MYYLHSLYLTITWLTYPRNVPHRCNYCLRTYANLATAQILHPLCTMYSCSFLPGLQYTIYPSTPSTESNPYPRDAFPLCCFCTTPLAPPGQKVQGDTLKEHITKNHSYRSCNQRLYFSGQRFRQHLHDAHQTSYDNTLFAGWILLLQTCRRQKPSVFSPVDPALSGFRKVYTDPGFDAEMKKFREREKEENRWTTTIPQKHSFSDAIALHSDETRLNFMDLSDSPMSPPPPQRNKLRKTSMQNIPERSKSKPKSKSKSKSKQYSPTRPTHSPSASISPLIPASESEPPTPRRQHHNFNYQDDPPTPSTPNLRTSTTYLTHTDPLHPLSIPPLPHRRPQPYMPSPTLSTAPPLPAPTAKPMHLLPLKPPSSPPSSLPLSLDQHAATIPRFYRRRIDASGRNRIYIRDEEGVAGPLGKKGKVVFRRIGGGNGNGNGNSEASGLRAGLWGPLVLQSSLVAGVVGARMLNGVEVCGLR